MSRVNTDRTRKQDRPFIELCRLMRSCLSFWLSGHRRSAGQAPTARARVIVTVVDPSGAVVPDATVTLVGIDDATKAAHDRFRSRRPTKALRRSRMWLPGAIRSTATFPGFELGLLKDIRLRSGDNKHVIVLPIQKVETEVTVGRDAQAVAADPRARFGTALTREQIEALSDDPAEMAQQLADMAGPNAIIRVDSFEGSQLPPKSQIKSIHITRDAFAAENHFAGGLFIDIITQPGVGALRVNGNIRLRDGSMSARNPFATQEGPENLQQYFGNIGGSLMKNKASFSLGINGSTQYITPYAFTYIPGYGQFSEPLPIKQPSDNVGFNGLFDYALTRDQTLRVSVNHNSGSSDNHGVGGNDSIERALLHQQLVHRRTNSGSRTARPAVFHEHAADDWPHVERPDVGGRIGHVSRGGCADDRRRSDPWRPSRDDVQPAVRPRLRSRDSLASDRHQRRWRFVLLGRRVQLPGHVPV